MAFTLPSDLPTDLVDGSSTVDAAFFNNLSGMGNSTKAAVATWGFNPQVSLTAASESTSSASYVDLTTTTDTVTAAIGSSGKALVILRADITAGAVNYGGYMGYEMSGANTAAATDTKCIQYYHKGSISAMFLEENLTAGFTTFKLKYRCASGTSTFANRRITVIPFPATNGTHESGAFTMDSSSSVGLGMSGSGYNRPYCLGVGAGATGSGSPVSFSDTVPAGTTCTLIWVAHYNSSGSPTITGSVGAKSAALIETTTCAANNNSRISCLAVMNPSTGTQTVSVTNSNPSGMVITTCHYSNVTAVGAWAENANQSPAACTVSATSTDPRFAYCAGYSYGATGSTATFSGDFSGTQRFVIAGGAAATNPPMLVGDSYGNYGTLAETVTRTQSTYGYGALIVQLFAPAAAFNLSVTPTLSFAVRSNKAVTFDSVGAGFANAAATAPSWSHTIGANAKALVVVATFYNNGLATPTFSNAKVGTKDLDLLGVFLNFTTGGWNTYTAYLGCVNPPTGTQTVTFTTGSAYIGANSFAYTNTATISALTCVTTANVSQAQTQTIVAASTSSDEMVLASASASTSPYNSFTPNQRHTAGSLYWIVGDSFGSNGNVTLTANCSANNLYGAGYVVLRPTQTTTAASVNLSVTPAIGMTAAGSKPTVQGANASHTTSVTIPAHQADDLIVIFAKGSAPAVSKPSAAGTVPAWVTIDSVSGSYTSTFVAYYVATSNDHTSGTWSGATAMVAAVIRGANTSTPIGGHAVGSAGATGNICTGTAITLTNSSGTSQILEFYGWGDDVNSVTSVSSAPSGHTRQVTGTYAGAGGELVALNTRNTTTSGAAVDQVSTSGTWWRSASVEVLSNVQP